MKGRAVVTSILLLFMATACFATGTEEETSGDTATSGLEEIGFNVTGYPIVDTPITVTAVKPQPTVDAPPPEEYTLMEMLSEKTNIYWDIEEIPYSQLAEKTNLMFAAREFPNVGFRQDATIDQINMAGAGGDIWDLSQFIAEYAPNWQNAFDARPIIERSVTAPDGSIYVLPAYREILSDYAIRDQQAINVDWLEKVGMPMPTTTDEFYDVLVAFREGIDNGTLPESGIPWLFRFHEWTRGEMWLYGAFDVWIKGRRQDGSIYHSVNDGVVEYGAADPKLIEAVEFLHECWVNELIPPEIFTDTAQQYTAKTETSPAMVGVYQAYYIMNPERGYEPLPVLAGPTGVRRVPSQAARLDVDRFKIFTNFEYPEALVRWIDAFAEDDFALQWSYGPLQANDDGTLTHIPGEMGESGWGPDLATFISLESGERLRFIPGDPNAQREVSAREIFAPFAWPQDRHFAFITYTQEETDELAPLKQEIVDYSRSTIANWIVNGGVRESWDDYVAELRSLGLERMLEIDQQAYDRFWSR